MAVGVHKVMGRILGADRWRQFIDDPLLLLRRLGRLRPRS